MFKRMGRFAQANLSDLDTETNLMLLETIAANPQLLQSLREALHGQTILILAHTLLLQIDTLSL